MHCNESNIAHIALAEPDLAHQGGNEEAEKARQELAAREEALMQATQEKEQHTALIKELQE